MKKASYVGLAILIEMIFSAAGEVRNFYFLGIGAFQIGRPQKTAQFYDC